MRPTFANININAFAHNLLQCKKIAPRSKMVAVVKANAYGHQVEHFVPQLMEGADLVAVCSIDEALHLRHLGYSKSILILEGFYQTEELQIIEQSCFIPVIHHQEQLQMLSKAKLEKPIAVWFKINSGMNRLGFAAHKAREAWLHLINLPAIQKWPVIMTHFACADTPHHPLTLEQMKVFATFDDLPGERSLCNSAGVFAWPQAHQHWIRPGLALYGASPFHGKSAKDLNLKPVMQIHTKIIAIQECQMGDSIGYGAEFICPHPMRIGVIAYGYADGYPQSAPAGTPVLVENQKSQIVGKVSMDRMTIDITHIMQAEIGSSVTLWGDPAGLLSIENIAAYLHSSSYELFCQVNRRMVFEIISN